MFNSASKDTVEIRAKFVKIDEIRKAEFALYA